MSVVKCCKIQKYLRKYSNSYTFIFISKKSSVFIVNKINPECDNKIVNLTINLANNGDEGTLHSIVIQTFAEMATLKVYMQVDLAESDQDKSYSKEFVHAIVDIEKLFKGIHGNFLVKTLMDTILQSLEFELKFPMKSVSVKEFIFPKDSLY